MKPKSAALKMWVASSSSVSVLLVPAGASLTGVTTMLLAAAVALNAVLPPLTEASPVPPAAPDDRSQARKVSPEATVPFQSGLAWKRTKVSASAASRTAAPSVLPPRLVQVAPVSHEYCQWPKLLSTAVTAIPASAVGFASLTCPAISAAMLVPGSAVASSSRAARSLAPLRTGAKLMYETLITTVLTSPRAPPLPLLPRSLVSMRSVVLPE